MLTLLSDPRIYALGRMSLHARVLHTESVADHRTAAELRKEEGDAVSDGKTGGQGRCACGEGG